VDGAGENFLAGAGLAFEKHGNGQFRRLFAARHFRAGAREVLERQGSMGPPGQEAHFFREPCGGERVLDRDLQPLRRNRVDHEILRAKTHQRDHRFDRAPRGLHDNRKFRSPLPQPREHRHAIWHGKIENCEIDLRSA